MVVTKTRLDVEVLTPAVGAILSGVDLATPIDPQTIHDIRQAVLKHGVIFFRGQDISREQTAEFLSKFGHLTVDPFSYAALEAPPRDKEAVRDLPTYQNRRATAVWHTDSTLSATPASLIALRAIDLPPAGGDTCFGSMYAAYETLSAPLQAMLDGLTAVHSSWKVMPLLGEAASAVVQVDMRNIHPVVRVHPETGRKALFVNRLWTEKIVELSDYESERLLAMLYEHSERLEFTVRWRWRAHDLALFDNRAFQHYAVMDYDGHRLLQKTILAGDRPFGVGGRPGAVTPAAVERASA